MGQSQPGAGCHDHLRLQARDIALRFLAYRPRSEAEVRRRLAKDFPAQVIDPLVEALVRQGLIDDRAFARQWRAGRERRRPRSQRLIRQELLHRGLSAEVIAESLEGFDDEANAYLAAERPARRLAARGADKEEFRRRMAALLGRRGFGFGAIRQTTRRLWQELGPDALDRHGDADDD